MITSKLHRRRRRQYGISRKFGKFFEPLHVEPARPRFACDLSNGAFRDKRVEGDTGEGGWYGTTRGRRAVARERFRGWNFARKPKERDGRRRVFVGGTPPKVVASPAPVLFWEITFSAKTIAPTKNCVFTLARRFQRFYRITHSSVFRDRVNLHHNRLFRLVPIDPFWCNFDESNRFFFFFFPQNVCRTARLNAFGNAGYLL